MSQGSKALLSGACAPQQPPDHNPSQPCSHGSSQQPSALQLLTNYGGIGGILGNGRERGLGKHEWLAIYPFFHVSNNCIARSTLPLAAAFCGAASSL
ncbi:hypothetical protein EON64_15795, partial [archaeon]